MSVKSMLLCKYEIHGGCNKKDTCPFQHRSRVQCYHQDRPGGCAKGADCLYMHHSESINPDVSETTISEETSTNLNDVEDVQKPPSPTQNIITEQTKIHGLSSKSTIPAPNTKSTESPSLVMSSASSKRAISPPTNHQVTSPLSSKSNQFTEEKSTEIVPSFVRNTATTLAASILPVAAVTDVRLNYGIRPFAEIMAEKKAKKAAEEAAAAAAAAANTSQQNTNADQNNTSDKSTPSQVKNPTIRHHAEVKPAVEALQNSASNVNHILPQSQPKIQSQHAATTATTAPQKRPATVASVSMPAPPKKQKINHSKITNPVETIEVKPEITVKNITTAVKRAHSQEIEQDFSVNSPNGTKRTKVNGISSSTHSSDSITPNMSEKGSAVANGIDDLDEFTEEDLEALSAISPEDLADFDLDAAERELGLKG